MKQTNTRTSIGKLPLLVAILFLSLFSLKGMAQPLLVEDFNYTAGALLTDNGWTAHSGAGTQPIDVVVPGLVFSGYAGSGLGGAANLDNNGEDDNKVFAEQTSGTVYAAAIVQPAGNTIAGYFLHFGQTVISTTFFTRVWMNATGDGIGLGQGSSAPLVYVPITGGVPVLVVLKYDITTKQSSLYVLNSYQATEPVTPDGTFTETATIANVGSIALRQFNAAERVIVDGIRVATTWADAVAPSSTVTPVITASPSTLNGFVYAINAGPSDSQSYNLSAADLTPASGNITVTPSTSYEISLDNSTFSSSALTVPYTGGALSATPVYVRLKAGLAAGTYTGEMIANSGGTATTANVTCNGVVEAPASTTLPYSEDFATGFGLCYTKSVSGPAQYWKYSSSGQYVYMNGFNTGVLEEDWLILPGINFNDYFNITLQFESWMRYGADDADNYFKVLYSSDYPGIGDPTPYTWTELTWNYPTAEQVWTPSGAVDMSTVTGSNVYIAFQYHYNVSFYRSWQIDNVSVLAGNTPVLTATPATLTGFTYEVGSGPSAVQTYALTGENLVGTGNITVTAPADYEISSDGTTFGTSLGLPYASTVITGQPVTVSVRLKAGLAIGNYNNEVIAHTGGSALESDVTCSGNVHDLIPYFSAITLPSYIQGMNGTNTQRVPFAYQATISKLHPNATYRYFNKVVLDTDAATSNGAGNTIYVNADGTFLRTTASSMNTPGQYGEFVSDANGTYTGWFMNEPSANDRFTPGNELFMRIMLNDGNNGTTVLNRITSAETTGVLNFGNVNQPAMGTGIRGISLAAPGNFVFLYDNVDGNGRPVAGTSIETTGIDFISPGSYVGFYTANVAGSDGSWGSIVPNLLPDGIRRIEERSNADGSLVAVHTSTDGVWGVYDTRNPFGGDVDILIINLIPAGEPILTVSPSVLSNFTYEFGNGPSAVQTYELTGTGLVGSGNITVTAPADYEISADGSTFTNMLEFPFADGVVTGQPVNVSVRLITGLEIGIYNSEAIVNSGGGAADKNVVCNGSVTGASIPGMSNVVMPLYIEGLNGTNTNRVPLAIRATLENLMPTATYRYFHKIIVDSDAPDYNGAGNTIFVAADGTFTRTTSTSLGTPGEYGEFTTDANGSYSGWFMIEPSGNARFTPGNELYLRVNLNDGAEGVDVATRLTTTDFATVLQFGTAADPTMGTAVRGISNDNPKDFVYLYDNVDGSGRPLCATQIETSGIDFVAPGSYAPFYSGIVAGTNGSWGGIVPNVNASGIQRIEVRDLNDGSLVDTYNSESGIWVDVDTKNPSGGVDAVLVIDLTGIGVGGVDLQATTIYAAGNEIRILSDNSNLGFTLFNLQGQAVYSQKLSGNNMYALTMNVPTGIYIARITSAGGIFTQKLIIR